MNSKNILFIHRTPMWYRTSFFQKISKIYDIKFVFTHAHYAKGVYGLELSNKSEELDNINFKILKNYFGVAFGVIKEAMGDYDLIIGNSWDSPSEVLEMLLYFIIAKLRRKKIVFWSEEWSWKVKSLKRTFIKYFVKLVVGNSDGIIVPGSIHKKCLVSIGISPEKIFIMPNARSIPSSEDNLKNKEEIKQKLGIENKKVILYVGRLVKRKGIDYLIKAFSKLNKNDDAVLIIIGQGRCKNQLQDLVKKLNIQEKVYFEGWVEAEKLPGYYLLSDLCVIPSITDVMNDPWVFIVNEAMQFGKPVIATDAVGAAFDMIVNGENGFMVSERNVEALYESMEKIISDPVLREKMGKKSKLIVETEFGYDNMVEGFISAVDHVLS